MNIQYLSLQCYKEILQWYGTTIKCGHSQRNSIKDAENLCCLLMVHFVSLFFSFRSTDSSKLRWGYFLRLVRAPPEAHKSFYNWLSSTADEWNNHREQNQWRLVALIYRDLKKEKKPPIQSWGYSFSCTGRAHSSNNAHLQIYLDYRDPLYLLLWDRMMVKTWAVQHSR